MGEGAGAATQPSHAHSRPWEVVNELLTCSPLRPRPPQRDGPSAESPQNENGSKVHRGHILEPGPLGPLGFDFAQHRQTLRPSVVGIRSKALRPFVDGPSTLRDWCRYVSRNGSNAMTSSECPVATCRRARRATCPPPPQRSPRRLHRRSPLPRIQGSGCENWGLRFKVES